MGRPRKPTDLRLLDGDHPERINGAEPKSPKGLGEPPDYLDKYGKEAWKRMADRLGEMNVATRADGDAIAVYCLAFSRLRQANERVEKDGLTCISAQGTLKPHPCVAIAAEAQRTMIRIISQFGMTPASRSTLHIETEPEKDEFLDFADESRKRGKAKAR